MSFLDSRYRPHAMGLKRASAVVLAGCLATGLGALARAGTIYTVGEGAVISNINDVAVVTDSLSSNLVGFSNALNSNVKYAQGFTSTGTAALEVTDIVLGLSAGSPVSSALVQIFSNTVVGGTAVPGSALATFTLSGTTAVFDTDTYNFTGSYTLAPSTNYWVVVADSAAGSNSSFQFVNAEDPVTGDPITPTGAWGYSWTGSRRARDGVTWANFTGANAGAIQVVAVPEPESLALLGVGAATVANGIMRRRKRTKT